MSEIDDRREALATSQKYTIVFFDGVCNLCNSVVSALVDRDRNRKLRYAALQGKTAESVLTNADRRELSSVIVLKNSRLYKRSDAVIEILLELPDAWPRFIAKVMRAIPRPLRDLGYFLVARWRYKIFGRKETCRIPSPEEKSLFLD